MRTTLTTKSLHSFVLSLLTVVPTYAGITINFGAADLRTAGGASLMPVDGLVIIGASTVDSTFGSPSPSAFFSGDDQEIYRGVVSSAGSFSAAAILTLSGNWNQGDPLIIYWFPTLTSGATAPGAGTPYGAFRTDAMQDGSDIVGGWVTPADGGTYALNFLTVSQDGANPNSAGWASLTVVPTRVVLYDFQVGTRNGQVVVRWQTASEVSTLGFRLYRQSGPAAWTPVGGFIPSQGQMQGGVGAAYEVVDAGAKVGETYTYKLVEEETTGGTQEYGPFVRTAQDLQLVAPLSLEGSSVVVRWLSRTNEVYSVQRCTDLATGLFMPVATDIVATPPLNSFTGRVDQACAFFRILVQ